MLFTHWMSGMAPPADVNTVVHLCASELHKTVCHRKSKKKVLKTTESVTLSETQQWHSHHQHKTQDVGDRHFSSESSHLGGSTFLPYTDHDQQQNTLRRHSNEMCLFLRSDLCLCVDV